MTAEPDQARSQPRRWLAVLLSLLWPGLGHIYAGRIWRGLAITLAMDLLLLPLLSIVALHAPLPAIITTLVSAPLIICIVAVDAARVAVGPRQRLFTRRSVLLACLGFSAFSLTLDIGGEWWRENWLGRPYRVPSAAMLPTLLVGDHFYVDPRAYVDRDPEPGDIVVLRVARDGRRVLPYDQTPDLPAETFVKRIVGVPGDEVRFEGATLYVNGRAATQEASMGSLQSPSGAVLWTWAESLGRRSYEIADDPSLDRPTAASATVESERYFVAGDNRDHSNDSRYWGTVHRDDILGRVRRLYWSWDFKGSWAEMLRPSTWFLLLRERTRWERIGQEVE